MALRPHPPISAPSLLLLLILILLLGAEAQPSPSSNNNNFNGFASPSFNSSTAIVIVILVSAFFFLAFFSIYMRNCSFRRSSTSGDARVFADGLGRRSRRRGLDPAVLETFPTLVYSDVKGHKLGNDTLECAVCLSEFSDDETLRLLPACNHVFHPDCIDAWLASHVTCPVCRSNLAATPVDSGQAEERTAEEDTPAEQVAIDVAPEASGPPRTPARFPRSHTTGHSVEGLDRFTLRLPEHVRKEIVAAGRLRRATSLVGFPAGGEASARIGYRGGRSERWARAPSFLARALSVRVPAWAAGRRVEGEGERSVKKGDAAEGSAKGIFPSVRAPFDCLGGGTSGGGGGGRSSSAGDEDESPTVPFARV